MLNARRHRDEDQRILPPCRGASSQCSTPEGIETKISGRRRAAWHRRLDVLNARRHRDEDQFPLTGLPFSTSFVLNARRHRDEDQRINHFRRRANYRSAQRPKASRRRSAVRMRAGSLPPQAVLNARRHRDEDQRPRRAEIDMRPAPVLNARRHRDEDQRCAWRGRCRPFGAQRPKASRRRSAELPPRHDAFTQVVLNARRHRDEDQLLGDSSKRRLSGVLNARRHRDEDQGGAPTGAIGAAQTCSTPEGIETKIRLSFLL